MLSRLLQRSATRLPTRLTARSYNFASPKYVECFGDIPDPDVAALRASTLSYLDSFDKETWHTDPVVTIVNGTPLPSNTLSPTVDAFNKVNGQIDHATENTLTAIITHINTYKAPKTDYRKEMRLIEQDLFDHHSGLLIGNQALDFRKQDGVTEIEESIQANTVERRLNDALLADIENGKISLNRSPAFIGCVSNFSNFLDLFRKTIRNMELGVPCVVLSRSNTTQHMYRWAVLLLELMEKHNVPAGMLTYASADIDGIKRIFAESPKTCPMLITCSRDLAADVKSGHPNTMSSTGGPNTLVAGGSGVLSPKIKEAIRISAMIENSGQCTALRHAVCVGAEDSAFASVFDDAATVTTSADALRTGEFAGVFVDAPEEPTPEGYTKVKGLNAHYKINDDKLPEDGVMEYWRKVFVDVTNLKEPMKAGSKSAGELASWLVRNQPITLAVNDDYELGRYLFEKTGQVVYTIGEGDTPALSCQARPQEGEIFGEFPVRKDLSKFTKFPVLVPTPTAAYNSQYCQDYLKTASGEVVSMSMIAHVTDDVKKGYCVEILNYLEDSVGAKEGYGFRTTLWGLQTPPQDGRRTVLKCEKGTVFDDIAAKCVVFGATNAKDMFVVQCEEEGLQRQLEGFGFATVAWGEEEDWYNVLGKDDYGVEEFPLAGQFCSLYLGVGHVKSTKTGDKKFLEVFQDSKKWLKMAI